MGGSGTLPPSAVWELFSESPAICPLSGSQTTPQTRVRARGGPPLPCRLFGPNGDSALFRVNVIRSKARRAVCTVERLDAPRSRAVSWRVPGHGGVPQLFAEEKMYLRIPN